MTELPFKAISVDMDGTFCGSDRSYDHARFAKILTELEKRNIAFIPTSGRPLCRLEVDFEEFKDRLNYVADNGAVLAIHNKITDKIVFSFETVMNVINYVKKHYPDNLPTITVSGIEHSYCLKDQDQVLKEYSRYYYPNLVEIDSFDDLPEDNYTKLNFHLLAELIPEMERDYNSKFPDPIRITSSGWEDNDIIPVGVNKAEGLKKLLQEMEIDPSELIAFGDGMNDVEMLSLAGISYVMENATNEVKKYADHIAPANTENGVLAVLENYLGI